MNRNTRVREKGRSRGYTQTQRLACVCFPAGLRKRGAFSDSRHKSRKKALAPVRRSTRTRDTKRFHAAKHRPALRKLGIRSKCETHFFSRGGEGRKKRERTWKKERRRKKSGLTAAPLRSDVCEPVNFVRIRKKKTSTTWSQISGELDTWRPLRCRY